MLQQLTAGYQGKKFQMKAKNADRSTSTGDIDPCAQGKRTLSASDSGPTPRRAKRDFLSVQYAPEGDFLSGNGVLWPRTLGIPSPARRKELLVRDGVEAVLTRYAKET